jgi:hypothetical protein
LADLVVFISARMALILSFEMRKATLGCVAVGQAIRGQRAESQANPAICAWVK